MKLKYNDKVHGYWLDGKRLKGVSTAAKLLDDSYSLDQWRKRMVAIGVAGSEELIEKINRTDQGDRDGLNNLAEEALQLAGASLAAEAGTATHTETERVDRGEPADPLVAMRWRGMLASAGLEIVPEMIERVVIYPEHRIAGRFDRLVRRVSDGKLVTIDLKTGTSAVRYPQATVTQLAMYANAPLLAGEMTVVDEVTSFTEIFTPMPDDLDRETGYMLHMPADGDAGVYSLNLKLGWKCVEQIILPGLRWRALPHEKLIKKVA
jgi:hypothetical protein